MRRLRGLPLQILAMLVLPLFALTLAVALGGVALHQSAMREMVASHNLHSVQGTAGALNTQLDLRRAALEGLAERLRAGDEPDPLLNSTEGWRSATFDGGLAILDAEGGVLAAAGMSADLPAALPDALAAQIGDGAIFYPLLSAGQPETLVMAAIPAGEGRWVVGVVSLEQLGVAQMAENLHSISNTTVALVAADRRVLYHSDPARIGQVLPPSDPAVSAPGGAAGSTTVGSAGDERIIAHAPIPAAGWTVILEEQWRESLALLTRYSQAAPLVLVPGLLIAAGAVWFGIRRIVWPLQHLEQRASELAWGNFDSIEQPVGGIEEIDQLQATLRLLAKRIRTAQAGMRSYIGAITRAQEEERLRLARELHDQTAQSLVAIGHREQKLKRYLPPDPQADALLAELRDMTARTVDDLRRIIRGMRPIYLEELGLVPALETLARDLQRAQTGIVLEFSREGSPQRLPPEDEIALYRIAQEALNNAWQHSDARRVSLSVVFDDDEVELAVQDDGRGFQAPRRVTDLTEQGHFGLMGIYERAALIGAQLEVESSPGEGTRVSVRRRLDGTGAAPLAGAQAS